MGRGGAGFVEMGSGKREVAGGRKGAAVVERCWGKMEVAGGGRGQDY